MCLLFDAYIVTKINDVLTAMIEWGKENPALLDIIIKIAGALAILGPTLLAVGTAMKLATSIGSTMAMAFNPITLIIMAIVGAIALLGYAWTNNVGGIQEKTKVAFDMVKATFEAVLPTLQTLFGQLFTALKSVWDTIGAPLFTAFGEIIKIIANLFSTLFPIILKVVSTTFSAISLVWKTVLKPVFDTFVSIVSGLYNTLKKPLEDIQNAFVACFDWIIRKVQGAIDLVKTLIEKAKQVAEFFGGGSSSTPSSPRTQYHADGGILTKATVFGFGSDGTRHVGGEAGAEAIIPLSKLPQILENMGMSNGGGLTVNNYSPTALSVAETARLYKQTQRELALGL